MKHIIGLLLLASSLLFLPACDTITSQTPQDRATLVTKSAASAEISVTAAAKGIQIAADHGAITPGSDLAVSLLAALKGANLSLDAAENYIAAQDYDSAQQEIDLANATAAKVKSQTPAVAPATP